MKDKIISGVFWNFINAFAYQGFPFIALIIAARILGNYGYGQFAMLNSTVILFSTFAGLGLGITATRYISKFLNVDNEKVGRIIAVTTLFGVISGVLILFVMFLIAPWLTKNILGAPDLVFPLRILSVLLLTNSLVSIHVGYMSGFTAFKKMARISLIQGLIAFPLSVSGVYFFGLTGFVVALVLNSILNLLFFKIGLNNLLKEHNISINYKKSLEEIQIIWKFGIPTMMSSIMIGPVIWVANAIIINSPGGFGQLGIFNAADQWRNILLFLPVVIGGVLIPFLSSSNNENDIVLEKINILSSWFIVILISLPLITIPEIIGILYGKAYYSLIFFQSLALMLLVSCLYAYVDGISRKLIAKNLMWWGFFNNFIWAVLLVLFVLILSYLGSLGLALSYFLAYLLTNIIFLPFYLSRKLIPRSLILSKYVILIWVILFIQTSLTLFYYPILWRVISLAISIILIGYLFRKIWSKNS